MSDVREKETQYKFVEVSLDDVDIRSEGLEIVEHFTSAEIAGADDMLNLSGYLRNKEESGKKKDKDKDKEKEKEKEKAKEKAKRKPASV
jgi:hypothetical protein